MQYAETYIELKTLLEKKRDQIEAIPTYLMEEIRDYPKQHIPHTTKLRNLMSFIQKKVRTHGNAMYARQDIYNIPEWKQDKINVLIESACFVYGR